MLTGASNVGDDGSGPGSPVEVAAAGSGETPASAVSRRVAAATDHANGVAAGPLSSAPTPSQDNTRALNPRPGAAGAVAGAAATGAAVIAGAADPAAGDTTTTGSDNPDPLPPTGA